MAASKSTSALLRLRVRLATPVDGASLAVFRIGFGVIMVWEVARYFLSGWIARYYIEPRFHFTYFGFDWVHPWP
ncbi:MAG TPA: HTTM domain-containing protein, partial [Gemmatimonadaceae bacterium]